MQVVCDKCSARYEFEAADIPAEGYDAQCTSCGHIFFVSPEGDAPSRAMEMPTQAELAESIQAEEPLAETMAEIDSPLVSEAEELPPTELDVDSSAVDDFPDFDDPTDPTDPTDPEDLADDTAPVDEEQEAEAREAIAAVDSFDDMMALSAQLGEPTRHGFDTSPVDDTELEARRRSSLIRLVSLVCFSVVAYVALTYTLVPQLFDKTIGQFIGIDAGVDPAAVPYCQKGQDLMLGDTSKALKNAMGQFAQAKDIDENYGDALAFEAITNVFMGSDFKSEGTHILDLKNAAEVELARLDTLSSKERPKDYVALKQGLLAQATASQTAQEWVEKGGRALMKARRAIESGLENHATNPNFKLATTLHRVQDSDTLTRAEQYLRMYLEGLGLSQEDLAKPSNHWMAYAHGMVLMANETTQQDAPAAFTAAITLEPRFQRARLKLAQAYHRLGKTDDAVKVLEQLVQAQPKHIQATRLLASWKTPTTAAAPAAKEVEEAKVESKKIKKGKKRGKKGKKRGKKGKKNKKGKKSKKGKKKSK